MPTAFPKIAKQDENNQHKILKHSPLPKLSRYGLHRRLQSRRTLSARVRCVQWQWQNKENHRRNHHN